jgi:hypothetical protein
VALTPAEKLKVLATARARFVRDLQDTFLNKSSGLGGEALAWDRSRGSDFRCLAQTVHCIVVAPKTTSIQATEKWLGDPAPVTPKFAENIQNTYRVFEALVSDAHYADVFRTPVKISPVEFIMVGILVHRHKRTLTMTEMANAVKAMRKNVREVHYDIRNNGKVYKTMSAFIDGYTGPPVSHGDTCAADAVPAGGGAPLGQSRSLMTEGQRQPPFSYDPEAPGGNPYPRAYVPQQ